MARRVSRVTRREFIGTVVATPAGVGTSRSASPAPAKRSNVLFILDDDLGYGDLSCYGDVGDEHLFDLTADPGEKADLRRKQAGTFEQIKKHYLAWNAQMLPKPTPS